MNLAIDMGTSSLMARSHSKLIVNQVLENTRKKRPIKYLIKVQQISNILLKLASTKKHDHNMAIIQETLDTPNIEIEEINTIEVAHPQVG